MSDWVYIKSFWPPLPVYHAFGKTTSSADLTICGQVIYKSGGPIEMTALPEMHAAKFGRPCHRCFEVES